MADRLEEDKRWEQVYLEQSHDAAIGRLFRGLIHNLNGAIQSFSLHSELLGLSLGQALGLTREILAQGGNLSSPGMEKITKLEEIIEKRSGSLEEMMDKVNLCRTIMRMTQNLPDLQKSLEGGPYTVNSAIRSEVEFLCADSFFKHKVKKELDLAEDLPSLTQFQVEVHQAVSILLSNALEAMRECEDPFLRIESFEKEGKIVVIVQDSGDGVSADNLPHIFEPFFATWPNHLGMGLYMARKIMERCCGEIECESRPGCVRFKLVFPKDRI